MDEICCKHCRQVKSAHYGNVCPIRCTFEPEPVRWDIGVYGLREAVERLASDAIGFPTYIYVQEMPTSLAAGMRCAEKRADLQLVANNMHLIHEALPGIPPINE